ncbi:high mobility group protein B2b [Danio aesculapii]|uniref:high mobility group protein B2b n=1 Tax=Danio aesculapii TaxID=1142201 RepID=UPI0024BF55D9|nr:high mobility group protein B2b [Danio aesculapii]
MVKGDVNKPKGKTSAYAFFVQTCRDEHKRKSPDVPVNFSEFSKKCSERWKSLNASDKVRFEDMAKADKVRYDREMKTYVPPKGVGKTGRKKKDPNAPKRPPSAFFVFCSEYRPTIKSEHPNLTIGEIAKKLGEMWSKQSSKDRAPFEQKAGKLREKYEKEVAAYRAGGGASKRGPGRPTGSVKKSQAEADDDDDEDEDEEDEDDDEEEEDEDDE